MKVVVCPRVSSKCQTRREFHTNHNVERAHSSPAYTSFLAAVVQTGHLRGGRVGDVAVLGDGTIFLASSAEASLTSFPAENNGLVSDFFMVHLTEEGDPIPNYLQVRQHDAPSTEVQLRLLLMSLVLLHSEG